jgi:hypothetical protein
LEKDEKQSAIANDQGLRIVPTPSIPEYRAIMHFKINFDLYFWSRKYKIYDIIIIPLDSYSKELSNGIIFISNISFFGTKINDQSLS